VCGSIKNLFKLRGEGDGLDGQSDGEGQGDEDGAAASDQAKAASRAVASVSFTNSPRLLFNIFNIAHKLTYCFSKFCFMYFASRRQIRQWLVREVLLKK